MKVAAIISAAACAAAFLSTPSAAVKCPKSSAWVHAHCSVTGSIKGNCTQVSEEIKARVNGQYGAWHDPHNNGTYTLDSSTDTELDLHRVTGNKKYTDKMIITLSPSSVGCDFSACSASQVTSVLDYSTNYCNLRMLYCSSADGCKPVLHDMPVTESNVAASSGQSDKTACLKV